MANELDDKELQEKLGAVLSEAEHSIDAETAQTLAAARREAVATADERYGSDSWRTPMVWGLGGSAAAAVLAFAVFTPSLIGPGADDLPPLDQPEFIASQEAELLEELEFVAWMMAMEESGEAPVSS